MEKMKHDEKEIFQGFMDLLNRCGPDMKIIIDE